MRYLSQVASHENASALAACGGFDDPTFVWSALHVLFKVDKFVGQNVSLWNEAKVLGPMNLT